MLGVYGVRCLLKLDNEEGAVAICFVMLLSYTKKKPVGLGKDQCKRPSNPKRIVGHRVSHNETQEGTSMYICMHVYAYV